MIKTILLEGFKDQDRALELGRLNLLTGRNGLGKSAFPEGLVYALSGRVQGGKSNDEVAKCFDPRGGRVRVTDDEGRWIERRVTVDHKTAKVSETLEHEPEEAEGAASIWESNRALLDFRYFVDLSSAKRRDFMLELVGATGGKLELERGREILLLGFAKELGGGGADESCILDTSKLPEAVRPIAAEWGPLWEYIESFDWPGTDASDALTLIVKTAKEKKNQARASAKEAAASLSELTVETRGAAIAVEEYEAAKRKKEEAAQVHVVFKALSRQIDDVTARREGAKAEGTRLQGLREDKRRALEQRPEVETPEGEEPQSLDSQSESLQSKITEGLRLTRELADHEERVAARDRLSAVISGHRETLAAHQNQPMGHMMDALHGFSDYLDDSDRQSTEWQDLKTCCEEVAASWRKSGDDQRLRLANEEEKEGAMDRHLAGANPSSKADVERNAQEVEILRSNLQRLRSVNDTWYGKLREAHVEEKDRRELREEITRLEERVKAAVGTVSEEDQRLRELGDRPDVAGAAKVLEDAAAELDRLERLRGAADAYQGAKGRAEAAGAKERAWTAFERAATDARETYVASLAEPIKADVGAVLTAVGRDESPYLELQNARGRPVFDLGWTKGDSRRSLNALSHGEATVFAAAVAVAIARRARGRRLLLVEADRIDIETLGPLLEGLGALEDAFDAVMVSTHHRDFKSPAGWRVHVFDDEGVTTRQMTEAAR